MPALGVVKLNWVVSCKEAEFIRWKKHAHRNFKAKKNNDKENQEAFLCDWLGSTGGRVLESHK